MLFPCEFRFKRTSGIIGYILTRGKKGHKMSSSKTFGKDKVIFATKEDHEKPSTVELPETERAPGLILANGEINWNCPCLGGKESNFSKTCLEMVNEQY